MRAVLDTNVLVSGIVYPVSKPGKILAAWRIGVFDLVVSHYILEETVRVLPRMKHANIGPEDARSLIEKLSEKVEIVAPFLRADDELRDQADQPVLGTLLASRADYLVTGDKDLLVLAERYPIVTPAEFWARHG
ncbi:putative toxin-antitoxin system toxin component, PIN family [Bryocella elongata]|uniref:Putative toxin-antitoxin system toxin component, PIN family n=1 Tax=Bryocella elongata TaxID=863522 RepID=A0A1H5Z8I6_9BACT|nr:putative toxin-antitoxin system toxin component, PIN family [Bryocella elongata]SEG32612.1 putative toxin-antitoxin system toxin component, PIN family [Bryocella elongata]